MIHTVGYLSLIASLALAIYAVAACALGGMRDDQRIALSGYRAAIVQFWAVSVGMLTLLYLLMTSDMSIVYVSNNTNHTLPMFYKFAALWGGQAGSLLLWSWMVSFFSMIVLFTIKPKDRVLLPYVMAVLLGTCAFFAYLNVFAANPFELNGIRLPGMAGGEPFAPQDGRGLNPLLQHWAMVIHPPTLYVGYVGFVVPFAFAIAALWSRRAGDGWIRATRRWAVGAWLFLGMGILLGGKWAYVELGWGGYWAWDPVENASLMPWLVGTAFIHSVIVQERRGMLKMWNVILITLTYLLCVFGTFLTRSGIVQSVHSFTAPTDVPWYYHLPNVFATFLLFATITSGYFIWTRRDLLKADHELDSLVSRESSFLFNNLVLLIATVAVFWGTLMPVFSELIMGKRISVGPPWFNRVNVPIGLLLLLLTGIGPMLAWRRTSKESLKKNFLAPIGLGIAVAIVSIVAGITEIYVVLTFAICAFVAMTIFIEFTRGAAARRRAHGETFLPSVVNLALANKRRYGGYIAHLGMVILFVGFAGNAFKEEFEFDLKPGDQVQAGKYNLAMKDVQEFETDNYIALQGVIGLNRGDREVKELLPERRFYKASEQPISEVALHQTLWEDVYVVIEGYSSSTAQAERRVSLKMHRNPLVMWVWLGGFILGGGTILGLIPNRRFARLPVGAKDAARA